MSITTFFLRQYLRGGWFRFQQINCTLASGRRFRYEMSDFPFRANATEAEAEDLAVRVIMAKYRYCQWDREHPKDNQELEIYNAVKQFVLKWVDIAQKHQAKDDARVKA